MPVLTVAKYFPNRMFGFLRSAEDEEVFFHLGDFDGHFWSDPPPIVGEQVEATVQETEEGKAPKAVQVRRLNEPTPVEGQVDSFSTENGWGFIAGDDGQSYYLHRSEVLEGRLPMKGQRVAFYGGFKNRRPRACYVTIEDHDDR